MHDPAASDRMTQMRDPFVGAILDRRFRVDEKIAAGGFGAIYRATHVRSNHQVALKILHPRMAQDERIVARFRREGATLTSLRSQYTVATYELVEDSGTLFIVMELLQGQTLQQVFQQTGRMPWQRVVTIMRAVCDSLVEAHAAGIVHRDLKPANIHLGVDDTVKVLDFGIAKLVHGNRFEEGGEDLTRANELVGTFDYISPEQIAGDSYSGRSDLYTLGIVSYEMITGQRPFGQVRGPALLTMIVTATPPPPSTLVPGLPPQLDRVLLRCLERDPDARFANAGELAAALDALLAGRDDAHAPSTADEEKTIIDGQEPPVMPPPYATPPPERIAQPEPQRPPERMAPPPPLQPMQQRPPRPTPPPPLPPRDPRSEQASLYTTLDGWPAPIPAAQSRSSQTAIPYTPAPTPAAKAIPPVVWIAVLVLAVAVGVILAAVI